MRLSVATPGRWSAVVEQHVDTALREPPLPAMRSPGARRLASGRFHPVEGPGVGTASYRLPTGRLALRLDDLRTSAYTHLVVWVSQSPAPKTTEEIASTPRVRLGGLKSTRGDQNYLLPQDVDSSEVRSVVIWWKPEDMAYTAAVLQRSRAAQHP